MDDAPTSLSDADLESELLTLNAHLNAGEYRFVRLLAVVLERELWAESGVRSCAHWLNWKFGIGLTAAREKVRVARALERLPLIREAFRKGEISYSKVRAVARVAEPESDEYLLMICRHGTASHVERLVRAYRGVTPLEEQSRAFYARSCEWWHDASNGIVVRARLPVVEGELVVKSLEAARAALDREARQAVHDDVEPWPGHDSAESFSRSSMVHEGPGEHDCAESGFDGTRLREIEDEHRRAGLRVGESRASRRADALVVMAETLLEHGPTARQAGNRHEVVVHIDAQVLADPRSEGRCATGEGHAVAARTARRLACDAALSGLAEGPNGEVLDVGRRTRAIPPAMRRALDARDGGCRFPGCVQTHWLDAHHIRHWASGGETRLSNLALTCRHHHRLLHEGGFTVSGDPSTLGGLVFRRADGTAVPAEPWLTDIVPGDLAELVRGNQAGDDVDIDEETGACRWDGVPMDMAMAVEGILQAHGEL